MSLEKQSIHASGHKHTQTHFFYWKVKTGYPIILRRISIITKVYYFLCVLLICVFCFANCLLHMCDCQTVSLAFVFFMRSRIILTTVCWVPRRGPRHLKQNMFKNWNHCFLSAFVIPFQNLTALENNFYSYSCSQFGVVCHPHLLCYMNHLVYPVTSISEVNVSSALTALALMQLLITSWVVIVIWSSFNS